MANKDLKVTKSNALIEARYKLSLAEQRIVLSVLAGIDPRKPFPKSVSVTAEQYCEMFKTDLSEAYKHLSKSADSLITREVVLQDDDEVKHKMVWVAEAKYHKRRGQLELYFAPSMQKYLSELTSRFTSYELHQVAKLNSTYSIRLYEMLMRWHDTGYKVVSVAEMRERLQVADGTYTVFADFRKRVIEPAVKEINRESSLDVEWRSIKDGRKIVQLEFAFKEKEQHQKTLGL